MEDMEMTTMTTGAAVTVSQPQTERVIEAPSDDDTVTSKEVFSDPDLGVDTPRDEAEMLFKSAKEEGFEEALTHLAEGDFEKISGEELALDIVEPENEIERKELQEGEVEEMPEKEKEELLEKIEVLEGKVSHLIEQDETLQERLIKSDERSQMSQEMLIEMFKYLYEMAKKEEDEKKKLSIFEILLAFVAKFMITVVDPDAKVENGKKEEKTATSTKKPASFEDMMKFIKEKGAKGFGPTSQAA